MLPLNLVAQTAGSPRPTSPEITQGAETQALQAEEQGGADATPSSRLSYGLCLAEVRTICCV